MLSSSSSFKCHCADQPLSSSLLRCRSGWAGSPAAAAGGWTGAAAAAAADWIHILSTAGQGATCWQATAITKGSD